MTASVAMDHMRGENSDVPLVHFGHPLLAACVPSSTPSSSLIGARLALLDEGGAWETALWGRNQEDKEYFVYNGFVSEANHAQPGMPATYGISLSYNFK